MAQGGALAGGPEGAAALLAQPRCSRCQAAACCWRAAHAGPNTIFLIPNKLCTALAGGPEGAVVACWTAACCFLAARWPQILIFSLFRCCAQGGALAGGPEGAAALLALLDRCLLLARGALAASAALPRALHWALGAACARETDLARAGLALLAHALSVAAGPVAEQVPCQSTKYPNP